MSTRPEILYPLFADLETLGGVGPPKTAKAFATLGVEAPPRDLLFSLPYSGVDRQFRASVLEVDPPATATVEVTVNRHMPPPRGRGAPYKVEVTDALTTFHLVFFHANDRWLDANLPVGQKRVVSGKVESFDGLLQIVHPDHIVAPAEVARIPDFEPVYHLASGITQRLMLKQSAMF